MTSLAASNPVARRDEGSAGGNDVPRDLLLCWWILPVFYALFGLIFVVLTRVMPPPPT